MRSPNDLARVAWISLGLAFAIPANGQGLSPDTLVQPDGSRTPGRFVGDPKGGFRFVPADKAAIPIDGPAEVEVGGTGPGPSAGLPSVQVVLGWGQSLSGQLVGLDESTLRIGDGPGGKPVAIDRRGVISLRQRPGEAMVFSDGFEAIDLERWSEVGRPTADASMKLSGEKSLRIAADGSAITASLPEPVGQGRLELAFHDTRDVVTGASWFVDLLFKGEHGPESLRAILGWAEESHAVQSSGGPALAVQRLARKAGWHRLEVRFGPDSVEMSLDGDALAHGKGPTGPLIEIRIGSSIVGKEPGNGLAAHVDDLRVVRVASTVPPGEADPAQDEVRLVEGDQVFGAIKAADPSRVIVAVLGRSVSVPWSDVSELNFRRDPKPSRPIEGLLAALEWRSAPGKDPRDLDRVEGAIVAADEQSVTLKTPYAGTLVIPRDRLRRIVVEGQGRRIVVDPTAHHMGDEVSKPPKFLDPPQPEGGTLERNFTLDAVPHAGQSASLVLDVVQVVGEANGLEFSELVRQGEIRTKVSINGKEFDYLNRHITDQNDTPARIRLPIPPGLLRVGPNLIKIVQTGTARNPGYFDDLGVLGMAVELRQRPPGEIRP